MRIVGLFFHMFLCISLALPSYAFRTDDVFEDDVKYYDYIIIGAGSAGSILARKLSDRKESVLVIDVGEFRYNDPVILTPDWLSVGNELFFSAKYAKNYPIPVGFLAAVPYSEGAGTIGGGGAHNFLSAARGTPSIFDSWAAATGDPRWLYNTLLPKMRAVEHYTPNATIADPLERGFNGPIFVTQRPPVNTSAFYQNMVTATANTSVLTSDTNNPNLPNPAARGLVIGAPQEFVSPPPASRRSYSALEFLPMSGPGAVIDEKGNGLHGRKLKVLTQARALRFNIEKTRAVSVEYIRTYNNSHEHLHTACLKDGGKLILSAGSIQTPNLLIHSGVGPAATLASLDIPLALDSPQVGENAFNHYGTLAVIGSGASQIPAGQSYVTGQPYTAVTLTNPSKRRIQFEAPSATQVGPGIFISPIFSFIIQPNSRGRLDFQSSSPLVDPVLDLRMYDPATGQNNFALNGTDANLIVSSLKILQQSALLSGYSVISPDPTVYAGGDAALFAYATDLTNWYAASHITSTARMGTNILNSVVDGRLKVHGLDNVYIGDNSVQAEIIDGNTNFAAYYIALELSNILGYPTPPAL